MNEKPTLQYLPLVCLREIVSYLPLPECMFLRASCHHLKTAVDEHFRFNVRTLPVLLSARYSPEIMAKYCRFYDRLPRFVLDNREIVSFGSSSGVSQWKMWEEKSRWIDPNGYFRPENYLVLFDLAKLVQFLEFIGKYLPGITKLSLFIDHDDHLDNVPKVLNLYREQLKVLLVEKTVRSSINEDMFTRTYDQHSTGMMWNYKRLRLPATFFDSILGLEALEELYFFTKDITTFNLGENQNDRQFINEMLHKLEILYVTVNPDQLTYPSKPEVMDKLEELALHSLYEFDRRNFSYPRLKKCLIYDSHASFYDSLNLKFLTNLREFYFYRGWLRIKPESMETLNSLPNLERIHCRRIMLEMYTNLPPDNFFNRTVKIIEIDMLDLNLFDLKKCLFYFKSLERVIIREPFMELTGNDLTLQIAP